MSKAFTTDSDAEEELPEAPPLPAGTRNYMTKLGAQRLRAEAAELTEQRRHPESNVEGKTRTQTIERRLRYLLPRLAALQEIDPLTQTKDRVLFGATVTVSDESGAPQTWRIVGLDEVDLERGWISWMSPLATALLEKRDGDAVPFRGRRLTVAAITYEA